MQSIGTRSRSGSKTLALVGLTAALVGAGTACEQKVENLGVNIALEKRQLANGMNVILVEDHTVPIVSYQTWFRVGSVDETPGITGISHLFEHLMFKGTPKYPAKQFFQQLEAHGAEVNAFTTRDYTTYYENFTPDLLEKVVDMESDRMANLTLTDEVLGSERMVVLEERRLRTENSPDGKMQEALWELAYHRHPYLWPVIGFPQDLLGLTTPVISEYFHSHYQPANATLVVVGDIKPDRTFAMIKNRYETIPARPRPKRDIPEEPAQNEERQLTLHDHVASQRFAMGYHVTAADNDDSYALDVLSNILFEGTSSRAYRRLVDDKDMALGVSGSNYTPTYPGLFIVSGSMKAGIPASLAISELDSLIREVQDKGVTAEEIRIAVRQLTVQLVDSVRTPYGLGQLIGTVQTIFGDPRRFAEDLSKYLKVTQADVQRVASKYLVQNNRSIVTMMPGEPEGGKQAAGKGVQR